MFCHFWCSLLCWFWFARYDNEFKGCFRVFQVIYLFAQIDLKLSIVSTQQWRLWGFKMTGISGCRKLVKFRNRWISISKIRNHPSCKWASHLTGMGVFASTDFHRLFRGPNTDLNRKTPGTGWKGQGTRREEPSFRSEGRWDAKWKRSRLVQQQRGKGRPGEKPFKFEDCADQLIE